MTALKHFQEHFVVWTVFQVALVYAGVLQTTKDDTRITDFEVDQGSNGNGIAVTVQGNLDLEIGIPGAGGGTTTFTSVTSFPILSSTTSPGTGTLVKGLDCGTTVQMYPGNTAHVFSTNFGVANYYNNEACLWRFEANQCTLSTYCPCVDLPRSWECLGDYLKISTDYILQNQRFCGGNRPGQPIYSDTDFLSIKFRSDSRQTAAGFTCFVRCEGPGMTLPIVTNVTCPTSV